MTKTLQQSKNKNLTLQEVGKLGLQLDNQLKYYDQLFQNLQIQIQVQLQMGKMMTPQQQLLQQQLRQLSHQHVINQQLFQQLYQQATMKQQQQKKVDGPTMKRQQKLRELKETINTKSAKFIEMYNRIKGGTFDDIKKMIDQPGKGYDSLLLDSTLYQTYETGAKLLTALKLPSKRNKFLKKYEFVKSTMDELKADIVKSYEMKQKLTEIQKFSSELQKLISKEQNSGLSSSDIETLRQSVKDSVKPIDDLYQRDKTGIKLSTAQTESDEKFCDFLIDEYIKKQGTILPDNQYDELLGRLNVKRTDDTKSIIQSINESKNASVTRAKEQLINTLIYKKKVRYLKRI